MSSDTEPFHVGYDEYKSTLNRRNRRLTSAPVHGKDGSVLTVSGGEKGERKVEEGGRNKEKQGT